jgi:hypothetical protein
MMRKMINIKNSKPTMNTGTTVVVSVTAGVHIKKEHKGIFLMVRSVDVNTGREKERGKIFVLTPYHFTFHFYSKNYIQFRSTDY